MKLRNGGIVDSDDLSRGWLLSRLLGRQGGSTDAEDGNGNEAHTDNDDSRPTGRNKWGVRGVSVSADDNTADAWHTQKTSTPDRNLKVRDDDFNDILDDDDDEDGDIDVDGLTNNKTIHGKNGIVNDRK